MLQSLTKLITNMRASKSSPQFLQLILIQIRSKEPENKTQFVNKLLGNRLSQLKRVPNNLMKNMTNFKKLYQIKIGMDKSSCLHISMNEYPKTNFQMTYYVIKAKKCRMCSAPFSGNRSTSIVIKIDLIFKSKTIIQMITHNKYINLNIRLSQYSMILKDYRLLIN